MLLLPLTVFVFAVPAAPDLDLGAVLGAARPSAARLAVEAELAEAARELSSSRGRLLEAPTLTIESGPRFSPDGDDFDLAVGLEAPLAADRAERRSALEAYEAARRERLAAAELETRLELELAYVDTWEAGAAVELAESEVETVATWLSSVEARVAAGAEAPYETTLVAAELQASRLALAAAQERRRSTWAVLESLADLGPEPRKLSEPAAPSLAEPVGGVESSLWARAITLRAALDRSLAALAAARAESRWSVVGSVGREAAEEVARVGLGVRLPLSGQREARAAALRAGLVAGARAAELERARLAARWAGARERLVALSPGSLLAPTEVERALAALDARVQAGKDRPSQVLPLRRQLLGALATALSARAARLRAAFEVAALTQESAP